MRSPSCGPNPGHNPAWAPPFPVRDSVQVRVLIEYWSARNRRGGIKLLQTAKDHILDPFCFFFIPRPPGHWIQCFFPSIVTLVVHQPERSSFSPSYSATAGAPQTSCSLKKVRLNAHCMALHATLTQTRRSDHVATHSVVTNKRLPE